MKTIFAGAIIAACSLTPAFAQTVHEIDAKQQAVVEAWQQTPLSIRTALLVTAKAPMYGAYNERKTNQFRAGEPILMYMEPVGYTWKPVGDNEFQFGMSADFTVKSPNGTILGGQDGFFSVKLDSHARAQELMMNVTIHLNGIKPGDYVLTFLIHDINNPNRTTSVDQAFTIVQ
jgi:hypothetical protein